MKLEKGMIFTIEPMINLGKKDIKILMMADAVTRDKNYRHNYEHTLGVTSDGYEVFTLSEKKKIYK